FRNGLQRRLRFDRHLYDIEQLDSGGRREAERLMRGGPHQWLTFRTQAGCASNSSGNSGSSTVTEPTPDLKRSGAATPSSVTIVGFAPSYSFTVNCRPGQRGRIAYRSPPLDVKKASMEALPPSGLPASFATSESAL